MKIIDLEFKQKDFSDNTLFSAKTEYGTITVLERLTGWEEGNIRDIETGFLDLENKFWLPSGNFDIRNYSELTIEYAISFIKDNANVCVGI